MIWSVCMSLYAVSAFLAWRVVACRPAHRPVAWLLSVGFFTDVVRQCIRQAILIPLSPNWSNAPFTGWPRAAFHVEQALFLLWCAGIMALSLAIFIKKRPWPVLVVYAFTITALILEYPIIRGDVLGRVYIGAELATVVVTIGSFTMWFWKREAPTVTHGVTLMVGAMEAVTVLPYRRGLFVSWSLAQVAFITLYIGLIIVYGGILWGSGSSSHSNSR